MSYEPLMHQNYPSTEHECSVQENYPSNQNRWKAHHLLSSNDSDRYRSSSVSVWFLQIITCILLITNAITLILNLALSTPGSSRLNDTSSSTDGRFKTIQLRYGSDLSYMSLDPQYDWLWSPEEDKYSGLIRLEDNNQGGSIEWGAITMFHQLHCLSSIRRALQRAQNGEDIGIDYRDNTHWPHCLHYLRQGILCAADDVIELPAQWNATIGIGGQITSKRVGAIDGSMDLRVCKDADELYKLRTERGYKVWKDNIVNTQSVGGDGGAEMRETE